MRSDRDGGYLCNELEGHFSSREIGRQLTTPYPPHKNGAAEFMIRTLLDLVRSVLQRQNRGKWLWAEALSTATCVRNRVASQTLPVDKARLRLWNGIGS